MAVVKIADGVTLWREKLGRTAQIALLDDVMTRVVGRAILSPDHAAKRQAVFRRGNKFLERSAGFRIAAAIAMRRCIP